LRESNSTDGGAEASATEQSAKRRAEAETLFERLRHEHRESRYWADAVYRLAEHARDAKDAVRVAKLVDDLASAKIEPETLAHALYLQGRMAATAEDWPGTETAMARLVEKVPRSSLRLSAEFWIAEASYRQNKFDEAGDRFAVLAESAKGTQAAWLAMAPLRRAQVLAQQKRWDEALALAATIEKEFPTFAQQYEADYLIGRCHAASARFEEARASYQKVTRSATGGKTETAAMAQWMIGESYFHQKEYDAAVKEYLRVEILYAYPRWQASALVQAGKAYEAAGKWTDAVKTYAQVLQKYAKTPGADEASNRLRVLRQRLAGSGVGGQAGVRGQGSGVRE
jgi:TolA-binding protein